MSEATCEAVKALTSTGHPKSPLFYRCVKPASHTLDPMRNWHDTGKGIGWSDPETSRKSRDASTGDES